LSEKWAVGAIGCRNNGPSEQWAVGIMDCRNIDLTPENRSKEKKVNRVIYRN